MKRTVGEDSSGMTKLLETRYWGIYLRVLEISHKKFIQDKNKIVGESSDKKIIRTKLWRLFYMNQSKQFFFEFSEWERLSNLMRNSFQWKSQNKNFLGSINIDKVQTLNVSSKAGLLPIGISNINQLLTEATRDRLGFRLKASVIYICL